MTNRVKLGSTGSGTINLGSGSAIGSHVSTPGSSISSHITKPSLT